MVSLGSGVLNPSDLTATPIERENKSSRDPEEPKPNPDQIYKITPKRLHYYLKNDKLINLKEKQPEINNRRN